MEHTATVIGSMFTQTSYTSLCPFLQAPAKSVFNGSAAAVWPSSLPERLWTQTGSEYTSKMKKMMQPKQFMRMRFEFFTTKRKPMISENSLHFTCTSISARHRTVMSLILLFEPIGRFWVVVSLQKPAVEQQQKFVSRKIFYVSMWCLY